MESNENKRKTQKKGKIRLIKSEKEKSLTVMSSSGEEESLMGMKANFLLSFFFEEIQMNFNGIRVSMRK